MLRDAVRTECASSTRCFLSECRFGESIGLAFSLQFFPRLSSPFPHYGPPRPLRWANRASNRSGVSEFPMMTILSHCFGLAKEPDCSSRDVVNCLKRLFARRLTLQSSIKSRSESLSWNTIHPPISPPGFDPKVTPVSPSALSQYCKRSWLLQERCRLDAAFCLLAARQTKTNPETAFCLGFQSSQCLISPNKRPSSQGLSCPCRVGMHTDKHYD